MKTVKNVYELFGTQADMEVDGVWIDYAAFRVRLSRSGGRNTVYNKTLTKEYSKFKNIDAKVLGDDVAREVLIKVFVKSVIKAWEVATENGEWKSGVHVMQRDKEGNPTGEIKLEKFTPENVIKVLTDLPDLFKDLMDQASTLSNFQSQAEENILGN